MSASTQAPTDLSGSDDPAYAKGSQWPLEAIGEPKAWRVGSGRGATVAVVDSGVDLGHPDLVGNLLASTDCIGAEGDPAKCRGRGADVDGHGTHVAGIIAAQRNNRLGIAGVAPSARLLAIRVLRESCERPACVAAGAAMDVVAGIRWATSHGADVINLSIGSAQDSLTEASFASAVRAAWQAGVIVVIAAGNDSPTSGLEDLPALVVTAVNREGSLASYAPAVGPTRWLLAGPGGEAGDDSESCRTNGRPLGVLSTSWSLGSSGAAYACLSGTSMAAPHVAGAAAVLRSIGFSPQGTVDRLLGSARDLSDAGSDGKHGPGLLALDLAVATPPPPGDASIPLRTSELAFAVNNSAPVFTQLAPPPGRPSLPLLTLGCSMISLGGAAALILGRHIWQSRLGWIG